MVTVPPTPPDPSAGSKWVPSDFLYIAASGTGLFAGFSVIAQYHPILAAFLSPVSVFLFWTASYAANKGD